MIGRNEALCKVSMTSDGGTGLRERSREQFFEGKILVGAAAGVAARTQRITTKGFRIVSAAGGHNHRVGERADPRGVICDAWARAFCKPRVSFS
jgi:hypothetical protein